MLDKIKEFLGLKKKDDEYNLIEVTAEMRAQAERYQLLETISPKEIQREHPALFFAMKDIWIEHFNNEDLDDVTPKSILEIYAPIINIVGFVLIIILTIWLN